MYPKTPGKLLRELEKIEGGYVYSGTCSYQVCFPLRSGGELRFSIGDCDDEPSPEDDGFGIDLYGGAIPPGVSGPAWKTGEKP